MQLVMIPGTLCDALLFEKQVVGLRGLADCCVADNASADNLEQAAFNILSDIVEPCTLLGLSYGGIIAFEIIRQAPKKVSRLILLNTNYKEPSETTRINQQRFVGMAHLGEFREITTDFLKDTVLYPDHPQQYEIRKTVFQMAMNTGKEAFYRQIKAQLKRPDSTKDLPNIHCPTLIITGREDRLCPVVLHEEMAALIPNSKLVILEHCGHLSTIEQPEKVNQAIITWWKETELAE